MHYHIPYDIIAIDQKVLLPAGSVLTENDLDALIAGNPAKPEMLPVVAHGSILTDLQKLLQLEPYHLLLLDDAKKQKLLRQIGGTRLALPVMQSLDYFRANDYYTYRHTLLVFVLTLLIAEMLFLDSFEQATELIAGPSHDIGKISIPLSVLSKKTPLTKNERSMLNYHALAGYVLLAYYLGDRHNIAAKVAKEHHERLDGSGYPDGIRQKDLLVDTVIVADIYDALISPRPYRKICYDNRTALEHLTTMAREGKIGWDPLRALVALNRKDKPHHLETVVSLEKRGQPPEANSYDLEADE